ncbi:MAG: DnaJ domain-containing protein [Acidimicrobiia bacterium]
MPDFDAYAVLGVEPTADPGEIRAAFRRMVQQRHPDTAPPQSTPASVQEVIEAYRTLMDPAARARYDTERARRRSPSVDRTIPVRQSEPRSAPERVTRVAEACPNCGGAGRIALETDCASCAGTGEITFLDSSGGRRLICRSCGGRGRQTSIRSCPGCEGRG